MSQQIQITGGAKVRNLEGVLTGTSGVVNSLGINVPSGIPQLDGSGKILVSQLPNSVMEYKGTWNAATNTPTLADGTGNQGDVYLCNVAGTANFGSGPIAFVVGDQVIYSGTIWQRASGATGTVTSVAVTESGDALTITGSPITTSGTINIGFTGTNSQYVNGAGGLTTFPTLLSSVGLSMPSAFSVANSPLTANGTIAVTGAGTISQYIRGDGSLATLPTAAQEAKRLITEVYNNSGATLTKGTVVYINGGQGNLPTITKALATSDATSAQTYGLVQTDITNMNNGFVVVIGSLMDLDTQAFTEGTQLYLSGTTAGAYTSTKPSAPIHLVYVAIVVRSHPTQGVIEVKIQNGVEMDELHDVQITSIANGNILQYDSATSLWKNVAGTTTNIAEGTRLYYTDTRARAALSFAAGSGAYNSTTGVITIPTNTNQLTNGASFITLTSLSAGTGITYNNTTGVITNSAPDQTVSLANGAGISVTGTYPSFTIASTITQYTDALARAAISLTTTGTSGASTYNNTTGVLNVPTYTLAGLGGVPTTRNITINGLTQDLSADRTWTITAGISSVSGTSPISVSTVSGAATVSIATANTTTTGALTSTDWNTFNGKQNALTNPVTGTGNNNYIAKFSSTGSTIANSLLQSNASNVFINQENTSFGVDAQALIRLGFVKKSGLDPTIAYAEDPFTISSTAGTSIDASNTFVTRFTMALDGAATFSSSIAATTATFSGRINAGEDIALTRTDTNFAYITRPNTVGYKKIGFIVNGGGNLTNFEVNSDISQFSGIIGVGVTPSAWSSPFIPIQIGTYGQYIAGQSNGPDIKIGANHYYNAGNYIYTTANGAAQINIGGNSGFQFNVAPVGTIGAAVAFTTPMSINPSGNVLIGSIIDNGNRLQVTGNSTLSGNVLIGTSTYLQSNEKVGIETDTNVAILAKFTGGAATGWAGKFWNNATTGDNLIIEFLTEAGITSRGSIRYDRTGDRLNILGGGSGLLFSGTSSYTSSIGIGVTPVVPTGVGKVLQIGNTTIVQSVVGNQTLFGDNVYYNGSAWKYITTNFASAIRIGAAASGEFSFHCAPSGSAGATITTWDTSDVKMVIKTNGNIGIGTSSPARNLSLFSGSIGLYNSSTGQGGTDGYTMELGGTTAYLWNYENDSLIFGTNNIERMRIRGDGGILINTTTGVSGGGALQVNGNVNINGLFQINGVTIGGGGGSGVTGSGTTNYIPKWTGSTSLGNSVIQDTGTNVGIGAAPLSFTRLYVTDTGANITGGNAIAGTSIKGVMIENSNNADESIGLWFRTGNNHLSGISGQRFNSATGWGTDLRFYTHEEATTDLTYTRERMRITTEGSILINRLTDAGYKFDVNGTGRFTGNLTTSNIIAAGSVTASSGFFDTSDSRLKIVIKDYNQAKGIEKVEARLYLKNNKKELGYFAQDVQEILPSAVIEGEDGFLTLSYSQVHTAKIAYLEKEIAELKELIKSLL